MDILNIVLISLGGGFAVFLCIWLILIIFYSVGDWVDKKIDKKIELYINKGK